MPLFQAVQNRTSTQTDLSFVSLSKHFFKAKAEINAEKMAFGCVDYTHNYSEVRAFNQTGVSNHPFNGELTSNSSPQTIMPHNSTR